MKRFLKFVAIIIGSLLVLVVLFYGIVYWLSENKINKRHEVAVKQIQIPSDSASLSKGKHIFRTRGCGDCHGENLQGRVFLDKPMVLTLMAPNLTLGPGGLPRHYSDHDWLRALRHGVDRDGRSLWMMPSHETAQLHDGDLANLIAYCKSLPPSPSTLNTTKRMGPVGRFLTLFGEAAVLPAEKINHSAPAPAAPDTSDPVSLGKYLTVTCEGCHRRDMRGGAGLAPGFPEVPDITSSGRVGKWTAEQFKNTLRTGITPEGDSLRNRFMPWKSMQDYSDDELNAIYSFLKSRR